MTDHPPVHENHRRIIATTLSLLDEMLRGFEQWTRGREVRSALYREHNALSPEQRRALDEQMAAMGAMLERLRDDLELPPRTVQAGRDIWSRASAFRENLMELEGRHLKAYGEPSAELVDYLEPCLTQLIGRLDRIADLARARE